MAEMEFFIKARRGDFSFDPDTINLFAFKRYRHRRFRIKEKLEFVEVGKDIAANTPLEPFLSIERHEAQMLMDSLWDCGLRPSEGSGSAGAMKKAEEHLADMRTIAFHILKIGKEQK